MKIKMIAVSMLFAFSGIVSSEEISLPQTQLVLPPPMPAVVLPIPLPNGGISVGAQVGGTGGIGTVQPHGGGYTSYSGSAGSNGTTFGGSVTTGPSGVIGGSVNFGTTF